MRAIVCCSLVFCLFMAGCSAERRQRIGFVVDSLNRKYGEPSSRAPKVADAGITDVSLNDDGWIIVEGRGAGSSDKLYVSIGGDEQVPMDVRPSADTGEFWVMCPNFILAASPQASFPTRIVVGPPSRSSISRPSEERFVWLGRISLTKGVTQS